MRYVVIGGAGAMGRLIVRDLVEFCPAKDEICVADYDEHRARELARQLRKSVQVLPVDVQHPQTVVKALKGAFVAINSVQYQWNLKVMESALAAKTHYIDLGGLFHATREQLRLHERFSKIGKTALIGMGAAPGITNILSRFGADQFETVKEIHTRVASVDRTQCHEPPALSVSYSLQTILEEISQPPAVFTRGKFKFVEPMSGGKAHVFPHPVGKQTPIHTLHSEVATLPISFARKGVEEVSFKIAFEKDFLDRVRFLRDLGFASHDPVQLRGLRVIPIEFINRIAMSQAPLRRKGPLRQCEVIRAIVKGMRKGRRETLVVDCLNRGMPEWNVGTDTGTGSPPAIAAQMLANNEIVQRGVVPAEVAVPYGPFFRQLRKRRMRVRVSKKTEWNFPV